MSEKTDLILQLVQYLESVNEDLDKFNEKLYDLGGEVCEMIAEDQDKTRNMIRRKIMFFGKLSEALQAVEELS